MPSKAIRAFTYEETRNELTLTFVRGNSYVYSLIPAALAASFSESTAKGAFHNEHIRDRFPFRKLAVQPAAPSAALRAMLAASVDAEDYGDATPASDRSARQNDGSRGRG